MDNNFFGAAIPPSPPSVKDMLRSFAITGQAYYFLLSLQPHIGVGFTGAFPYLLRFLSINTDHGGSYYAQVNHLLLIDIEQYRRNGLMSHVLSTP